MGKPKNSPEEKLEHSRKRVRRFHLLHPYYTRFLKYKQRYGLSKEQYANMGFDQDWCCKICGIPEAASVRQRLFIDHNHETGKVRALLCDPCNRLLADAKENTTVLKRAIQYIEEYN